MLRRERWSWRNCRVGGGCAGWRCGGSSFIHGYALPSPESFPSSVSLTTSDPYLFVTALKSLAEMLRADRRAADNVLLRCAKTRYGSAIALQGVHWHFPKHYSIRDNKNVLFFRIALVSFRRFTQALIARCSSSAHPPPSCSSATQALLRPYSSPAYSAHSAQVLRRLCSGTLLLLIQYLNHDWSFCHIDFVNFRPW